MTAAPDGTFELRLRDELLRLHPDRALSWPARRTLVVADTHFGKDDVFRRAGLAIPEGAAAEDLARLTRLLESTASERLVVLGDFVHGAVEHGDAFPARFAQWRRRHCELAIDVVLGNHDRSLRHPDRDDWTTGLRWHAQALQEGRFDLVHDGDELRGAAPGLAPGPDHDDEPRFALSGHVHPVTRLPVPGGRALRVPVFWQRAAGLVLPSFGRFTGGQLVRPGPDERLLVSGPARVHALRAT